MFANLHKRILHQMKTRLSLRWINSAACGNHRKPRGCCVTHSFTFGFTTRCLCKMLRKIVIEIKPSKRVCFLVIVYSISCKISLKSSRFFFLEKYQETCVCENRIHKIQTSTGLYKSISVCLMTNKNFSDHFRVTAHSNNRNSKSSREVILGSVRL